MNAPARAQPSSQPSDSPRGMALLRDPLLNKGTAFTEAERDALGLRGLLPAHVLSMEEQAARVLTNLRDLPNDLEKYVALNALHDRNEALFFRVVCDNIDEIQPLIYTPTVGLACQRFGLIFQRPRGMFISANDRGRIAELLANWPYPAKLIVVTDGERILGLGDLGANGMGIPVGKLSLYSACAGIHPEYCLPVMLDVGTNNEELLNDPLLYRPAAEAPDRRGLRRIRRRIHHRGARGFPRRADPVRGFRQPLGVPAAAQISRRDLRLQRRHPGHGRGGARGPVLGAARHRRQACRPEGAVPRRGRGRDRHRRPRGLRHDGGRRIRSRGARGATGSSTSRGLVVKNRAGLTEHKLRYAHDHAPIGDFLTAIRTLKPTAIIGVAAVGGAFTPEVLQAMAELNERPIVFALSNPTSKAECTAEEAYRHTGGRALFACGSPFDPVKLDGKTFVPRQGNNSYIFPGVGLGAIASGSRLVTDEMFMAAAHTLADLVDPDDIEQGSLYPALPRIREVSAHIAAAVAEVAYKRGLATVPRPNDLMAFIESQMYDPQY